MRERNRSGITPWRIAATSGAELVTATLSSTTKVVHKWAIPDTKDTPLWRKQIKY